jgi:hypothetical protein
MSIFRRAESVPRPLSHTAIVEPSEVRTATFALG